MNSQVDRFAIGSNDPPRTCCFLTAVSLEEHENELSMVGRFGGSLLGCFEEGRAQLVAVPAGGPAQASAFLGRP